MGGSKPYMIADNRLVDAIAEECPKMKIVRWRNPYPPLTEVIGELLAKEDIRTLGIEAHRIDYKLFKELETRLPHLEIKPVSQVVGTSTLYQGTRGNRKRSPGRILCGQGLSGSSEFHPSRRDRTGNRLRTGVRSGQAGSQGTGFATIIASGHHAAMPPRHPLGTKDPKGRFYRYGISGGFPTSIPRIITRTVVDG